MPTDQKGEKGDVASITELLRSFVTTDATVFSLSLADLHSDLVISSSFTVFSESTRTKVKWNIISY